jgi:hypothetical protein
MTLNELINKSCLIGLSYFNLQGQLLKQSQLAGTVIAVDLEEGISIELTPLEGNQKPPIFKLPPTLSAWFTAPAGNYRDSETGLTLKDPAYLVTWDIRKTKDNTTEGQHEWWDWQPRTEPPQVGNSSKASG